MQTNLEKLGDAQGKMLLYYMEGNKEREEYYRQVQFDTLAEMSKAKKAA